MRLIIIRIAIVLWWIGALFLISGPLTTGMNIYLEKSCLSSLPLGSPVKWDDGAPNSYSYNRYGIERIETIEEQKSYCVKSDKYAFLLFSAIGLPFFLACYILSGSLTKPPIATQIK